MQSKVFICTSVVLSIYFVCGLAWAPLYSNVRLSQRQRSEQRRSTVAPASVVGSVEFASACRLETEGFVPEAAEAFKALAYDAAVNCLGRVDSAPNHERAYIELRRGHLAVDGLGLLSDAAAHLRTALELDPGAAASLDFLGCILQTDTGDLTAAFECFAMATATPGGANNPTINFHKAVANDLSQNGLGDFSGASLAAIESWRYAQAHFPGLLESSGKGLYNGTRSVLAAAIAHAEPLLTSQQLTMVLEFGVSFGKSLRMLADLSAEICGHNSRDSSGGTPPPAPPPAPHVTIAGFDTFTGLPEAWGNEPAGTYSTGGHLPPMPAGIQLVQGLFSDTLSPFLREQRCLHLNRHSAKPPVLALANVDCDLYSATVDIMHALGCARVVVPGSVLVFDEYFMYPGWQNDEYKAFQEACARFGWKYKYIAWSLSSKQVAVQITAVTA